MRKSAQAKLRTFRLARGEENFRLVLLLDIDMMTNPKNPAKCYDDASEAPLASTIDAVLNGIYNLNFCYKKTCYSGLNEPQYIYLYIYAYNVTQMIVWFS